MSEREQDRKDKYRRVRTDFDELETEDKVVFLMEAAVSTVARGIDEFGRAVSDEINKAFRRREEKRTRKEEAEQSSTSESGEASPAAGPGSTEGPAASEGPGSTQAPGTSDGNADTPTDIP